MKHLNLELQKLEQRIAPGGWGSGCGGGKSHKSHKSNKSCKSHKSKKSCKSHKSKKSHKSRKGC